MEYGPVLRPVYSLSLLLNPHHYHMYDASSQEEGDVPLSLQTFRCPVRCAQMLRNRVVMSRIAVSDGQPTPLPLAFVRDWLTLFYQITYAAYANINALYSATDQLV